MSIHWLTLRQTPRLGSGLWLLGALLLGLGIPLGIFCLATPLLGANPFEGPLTITRFFGLLLLITVGLGYLLYWRYIRPLALLYFMLIVWPPLTFLTDSAHEYLGINFHLRALILAGMVFPTLYFTARQGLWRQLPFLKPFLGFLGVVTLYFFVYNHRAMDGGIPEENLWGEASLSATQLIAYYHCLTGILLVLAAFRQPDSAHRRFDTLNQTLLLTSAFFSLLTILGYPLHLLGQNVDGFYRAQGIYNHPNPFAHHMGLLLLYSLGLGFYYHQRAGMPWWLFLGATLLNGVAFLLGLSKTALGLLGLCTALFVAMNGSSPLVRRYGLRVLGLLILGLPLSLWGVEIVTGKSFFVLLADRLGETSSLDWRVWAWNTLLWDFDPSSIWLGHGFTAGNARILSVTYDSSFHGAAAPLIWVHNGYLALLYDFGLPGFLCFFGAVLTLGGQALWGLRQGLNPLLSCIVVLCLYFLGVAGFDEMVYMYDAAIVFWVFATLCWVFGFKERGRVSSRPKTPSPGGKRVGSVVTDA